MIDFLDKSVLIAGGAGELGQELTQRLLNLGACIHAIDLKEEPLFDLRERNHEAAGRLTVATCDITQRHHCQQAVTVASRNFGQLDLLICAAGILHVHHHGLDVTRFQLGIRTNLLGPLYLIDSVLAKRLEQPSKPLTIVVLSSLLAGIAPPALAEYGISKLALNQAVRAFQEQYRESNVRFLLVQPGFIRTPFTNEFRFRPFSISTAQATSRIVDGIRSDRTYLSFPLAARGLAQIARRLPKISNQLIKRLLKPATKSPTTPESSPNNP